MNVMKTNRCLNRPGEENRPYSLRFLDDIEADYKYCIDKGYTITTNAIECIPTVFEKGVRYFKIAGPSGEEIEFCQILK